MEQGWNFQGHIALPLEHYGRKYIGGSFPDASEIAGGEFADAMLSVLSIVYGDLKQVSDFAKQCDALHGMSCNDIPSETAAALFQDFERLIKSHEREK